MELPTGRSDVSSAPVSHREPSPPSAPQAASSPSPKGVRRLPAAAAPAVAPGMARFVSGGSAAQAPADVPGSPPVGNRRLKYPGAGDGNIFAAMPSSATPPWPGNIGPTEADGHGHHSPSSTVDLHGPGGFSQLGRTPSAPDSLLITGGGLELSDSMSMPSLTVSTNSSSNQPQAGEAGNRQKPSAPASPAPAGTSVTATAALPAGGSEAEMGAALSAETEASGRRTPPVVHEAPSRQNVERPILHVSSSPQQAALEVEPEPGDENVPPPAAEAWQGNKEAIVKDAAGLAAGRSEVVAKMRSYWEGRTQREKIASEAVGSSLRERHTRANGSEPNVLKERGAEVRARTSEPACRDLGSHHVSRSPAGAATSAKHAGVSKENYRRRAADYQQLQERLTTLFHSLCPSELEEGEMSARSDGSDSDSLADEIGRYPSRGHRDEPHDWCRALEKENKALWRSTRQMTRLLTCYAKKRSSSCGSFSCPHCSKPISCPQCGCGSSLGNLSAPWSNGGEPQAKMAEAPARCLFAGPDAGGAQGGIFLERPQSLSPSSSPTAQEEPAGEPDSGLLCA